MHSRVHRSPPPAAAAAAAATAVAKQRRTLDSAAPREVLKSHNCDIYIRATLTTRDRPPTGDTARILSGRANERTNERMCASARSLIYEGIMQSSAIHDSNRNTVPHNANLVLSGTARARASLELQNATRAR